MNTPSRTALVLLAAPIALLSGCANVGDTNPTSPEKMEEIRQKQNQERGNFHPTDRSPADKSGGR